MEQLVIQFVMSLVQSLPQLIIAINNSTSLTEDQRKEVLMTLNTQLLEAKNKVSAVRFKKQNTP